MIYNLNKLFLKSKSNFKDIINIITNIPKEEHKYFYHGDKYVDSPYLIYRDIAYYKSKPVAFIDIYKFNEDPIGTVIIASVPEVRGKGINDNLINKAIRKIPKDIDILYWKCDKDNIASYKLALKHGFKLDRNETTGSKYILKKELI